MKLIFFLFLPRGETVPNTGRLKNFFNRPVLDKTKIFFLFLPHGETVPYDIFTHFQNKLCRGETIPTF